MINQPENLVFEHSNQAVPKNHAALVVAPDGGVMVKYFPEDPLDAFSRKPVPDNVLLVAAIAAKLGEDPHFGENLIAWLIMKMKSENNE